MRDGGQGCEDEGEKPGASCTDAVRPQKRWETWELIRGWIGAGVTSYSAWNMVLDTIGLGIDTARVWPQDSLLTVNTSTKTLTPAYLGDRLHAGELSTRW